MKAKDLFIGALAVMTLASCNRYFTPERAANTGGKKCSKRNRITQIDPVQQNTFDIGTPAATGAHPSLQATPSAPATTYTLS